MQALDTHLQAQLGAAKIRRCQGITESAGPIGHTPQQRYLAVRSGERHYRGDRGLPTMSPMARPRSELIDRENGGFYHLYDRCVRQAWLCGEDPNTGENFDHRREWIEHRMLFLTEIFPIDVYAYAVMSNHYHIVVNYCPDRAREWSDDEVARRWARVFGIRSGDPRVRAVHEASLLADPVRLSEVRQRLGDLSWYMRCLNEHIARRANAEEDRTGRFWNDRFESRPLADAQAVHACMVYNDLNPLRAGMVDSLDAPQRTSLRRRLEELEARPSRLREPLEPLRLKGGSARVITAGESALPTTLASYLTQVEWTAARCQGERTGTDPPFVWRGSDTWLKAFAAQRRRGWRRGETPAWLIAIT